MDTEFSINVMGSSLVKGKRSKRFRPCFSAEEQEGPWGCSESTLEEDESEDEEMAAHSLMLLSHDLSFPSPSKRVTKKAKEFHYGDSPYQGEKKSSYKCKTCSKVFLSFQALGGHRATCSHTTATAESAEHTNEKSSTSNKMMKVHECSICHRVFSSGQALGGHKRTHSTPPPPTLSSATENENEYKERGELDLNMPPPLDDCYSQTEDSSAEPFYAAARPQYRMSPPFWCMTTSGKRVPSVYNGNIAHAAQNEVLFLGRDLGLKPDLFALAAVN